MRLSTYLDMLNLCQKKKGKEEKKRKEKNTLMPPKDTLGHSTGKKTPFSSCESHWALHLHRRHRLLRGLHLLEHVLRVEPRLEACDLELLVHLRDRHALDVEHLVVRLDRHRVAVFILSDIVALHPAPVTPLAHHHRWPAVYLEDLPRKVRHHVSEGFVTLFELGELGPIVLVRGYDRAIGTAVYLSTTRFPATST